MRQKLDDVTASIEKQLDKVARDLSLEKNKVLKLESNAQLGFFFRITRNNEKVLRNNKSYQTIDTNKNGVRFRNAHLQRLNEEYLQLKESYNEQQQSVVDEIVGIAGKCKA